MCHWWRHDGNRETEGEHVVITITEGQGTIACLLSGVVGGEGWGLEHGGLDGEDGIKDNVGASSEQCASTCAYPRARSSLSLRFIFKFVVCTELFPVAFTSLPMFYPPLDSTVVVDIPSNARAGGVSLLFRAHTGSASALEQLKRDSVRVQAWTNAPVDNDRADGQWGAYNFEEAPAAPPVKLDDSVVPFALPPPTEDNIVDEPHTLFLTLTLKALPRYQTEADFLVTYRLLYPNGEIKWLGYHGRDLRCVLKKTDPWLVPPLPTDQHSGSVYRVFSSITMREPWGCWAIGPRCVKYYPKGQATDCEASFLVFVPKRGPSTFALHQPIILHGAGLKLDSSGVVTCRASTPTRVYTAITSELELSSAIPDLGLHWFGVKEGYAFITSAAPEQPVSVHAVPLFVAERSTTVSLDLASQGLLADHPRFVAYSPLSNGVLDSNNWGSRQLHLSIRREGGSCVLRGESHT
ncbi:hypothetical protein BC826DRAFT_9221 [Russula brevipes]|nr:hypothetical protein BC826DRAFT_9221 [Russula brevipes]